MTSRKKFLTSSATLLLATLLFGCTSTERDEIINKFKEETNRDFQIHSTSVADGDALPSEFSCEAKSFTDGISPELHWDNAPAGTKSFVVVFKDTSLIADSPQYAFHWVMWNIPASATSIPTDLPEGDGTGALEGAKQLSGAPVPLAKYFGPCPAWQSVCPINPPAKSPDNYSFTIYAMSEETVALPAFDQAVEDAKDDGFATQIHAADTYFASMAIGSAELKVTSDAAPGSEAQASFTVDTPDGPVTVPLCPTE